MSLTSTVEAASNRILGGLGRAIDVAGQATPTAVKKVLNVVDPFKIKAAGLSYTNDSGASENLEYQGSKSLTPEQRVTEVTSQGKPVAGADSALARSMGLNFTYDTNAGIPSSDAAYNQQEKASALGKSPTDQFTTGEIAALGLDINQLWNNNEITLGGQKYKVVDNGNGTRSFQPISSGDGGGGGGFSFDEGVSKAGGADLVGQYLSQADVDEILRKYSEGAFGRADDLGAEIERVARENAEREYGDVISALGDQSREVSTLGAQQKERALTEKQLTEAEMAAKQESELKGIEKERTGFIESDAEQKDQLGRAWKDMSLEVQRIMRGRGIADSSFATEKEVGVLKDFNKGLRELAVKKTGALKDFADAVIETNGFYQRKKLELAEEVRQRVEDVDNWVRQQATAIMQQQRTALTQKLSEINNAILQARELKTNIANQVAQTELNFGMWLKQTEVNYKLAVAEAAKGKVSSAQDTIAKAAELSKNMFTMLQNGQAQWVQQEDGTMAIQDLVTGTTLPTRTGYKDEYDQLQEAKASQQYWSGVPTTSKITGQVAQQALTGTNTYGSLPSSNTDEEGGLMSSIANFLQ